MKSRKTELRRELKSHLSRLADAEKVNASGGLAKNLRQLLGSLEQKASLILNEVVIGVFAPLPDEIDWQLSLDKEMAAYPGYEQSSMNFYACEKSELIESHEFGVKLLTPPKINLVTPDLIFVPGLAFTSDGHRLGRGKGFYDRYLSNFEGITIGVSYEIQILAELPVEEHDFEMDYVVTENRIFNCSES